MPLPSWFFFCVLFLGENRAHSRGGNATCHPGFSSFLPAPFPIFDLIYPNQVFFSSKKLDSPTHSSHVFFSFIRFSARNGERPGQNAWVCLCPPPDNVTVLTQLRLLFPLSRHTGFPSFFICLYPFSLFIRLSLVLTQRFSASPLPFSQSRNLATPPNPVVAPQGSHCGVNRHPR